MVVAICRRAFDNRFQRARFFRVGGGSDAGVGGGGAGGEGEARTLVKLIHALFQSVIQLVLLFFLLHTIPSCSGSGMMAEELLTFPSGMPTSRVRYSMPRSIGDTCVRTLLDDSVVAILRGD